MIPASQAVPIFLDELRLAKRSSNTIRTYEAGLRLFLRLIQGDELSEKNFIRFLQKTGGMKAATHITYRAAVSRLYQYHAPGIPVKLLIERYGRKKGKRFPSFDEEAVEKLIEYAEGLRGSLRNLRDRAFILTACDTGARISEACSLIRSDINFEEGRAVIIGKGDKQGVLRFSDRSLQAIRDYLSARAELDGKSGKPLGSLPLFARHDPGAGSKIKPIGSKGMWAAFAQRMKEAGIPAKAISPHKMRGKFVTDILRANGGDIVEAQLLARHEDINTTSGYNNSIPGRLDDRYKQIFNPRKAAVNG